MAKPMYPETIVQLKIVPTKYDTLVRVINLLVDIFETVHVLAGVERWDALTDSRSPDKYIRLTINMNWKDPLVKADLEHVLNMAKSIMELKDIYVAYPDTVKMI